MKTEEVSKILDQIEHEREAGNDDEVHRLTTLLPLPPRLALLGKQTFGADWMVLQGYDLSRANKEYGKDWING